MIPKKGIRYAFSDGAGKRMINGRPSMGLGSVLIDENGEEICQMASIVVSDDATSIMAEFLAMEQTIRIIQTIDNGWNWYIHADNEYLVSAMIGDLPVRKPHLKAIMDRIRAMCDSMGWRISVVFIQGKENLADKPSRSMFEGYSDMT